MSSQGMDFSRFALGGGILHEILHALGLQHPTESSSYQTQDYINNTVQTSRLSYWPSDTPGFTSEVVGGMGPSLAMWDILALQTLYGRNDAAFAGDTVYGFNSNSDRYWMSSDVATDRLIFTVWDGSGNDTFDFSGYSQNQTISLRDGTYSDVGGDQGLVGIAVGAVIENAIGGTGSDLIIGNDAGNILKGNGGADFLDGGAGVDTALYASARRMYVADSTSVTGASEGTDALVSIENLRFVDGTLTFDAASQAAQVMRMYDAALARQSDQGGFENWLDRLEGGLTLTQMAQAFLDSAEFQANFGGLSNQDYVAQLYRTTLRREPDAGGLANWTARLDNGSLNRTDMLVAFSESAEHVNNTASVLNRGLWVADDQAKIIARLYDATFDRLADVGGLAVWTQNLKDGMALIDIAAAFASAAEFQQKYGNLSNADFVAQMYRFTLNREPDAGGLAGWTSQLDSGALNRAQMLLSFSESAEHVRLTAGLWLGGIQVAGGNNSALAAAEPGKAILAPEDFRDPIVIGSDSPDDDAFVLAADLDLTGQVMPTHDAHKAPAPDIAAVDTLPPAWFQVDVVHGEPMLAGHDPAANDIGVRHLEDHERHWMV